MDLNPADFGGLNFNHSPKMLKEFTETFGFQEFRDKQLEAINATILKENVFVVGGNAAGKSLCYQLPACLAKGVTVVILPLKAIIQDQIEKLSKLGIKVWTPLDDQGHNDVDSIYGKLVEVKLLYITPEKLGMNHSLKEALQRLFHNDLLTRFVVDEAHCISQWGYDFRKEYGKLNELQKEFPGVPMIALSAPIGPSIQKDILERLQMTNPRVFTMNVFQTNLKYAVQTRTTRGGEFDCMTWINTHYRRDSGIVYCWRIEDCDDMVTYLNKAGLVARAYHSKIQDRESAWNEWNENKCQVICATVAFGMGIHKPDVRYVIHSFLPKSMERYYRETGRAGRDGNLSHCILFYSYRNKGVLSSAISEDQTMDEDSEKRELDNLNPMVAYCENFQDCRRKQLLTYFDGVAIEANSCNEETEAICDNCERANVMNVEEEGEG